MNALTAPSTAPAPVVDVQVYEPTNSQGWAWELRDERSRRCLACGPGEKHAPYATREEAEQAAFRRADEKGWVVAP